MSDLSNYSAEQLRRMADIKEEMDTLQRELDEILSNPAGHLTDFKGASRATKEGRFKNQVFRKMAASARAKIGAAQRARWAKVKAKGGGKRKMSPTARAKIAAAAKARWKIAKAAGKNSL